MADIATQRVLIIDDASLVRFYYRDILERAGFEVDEALNGLEALERLLTDSFDLLIVDVNMPQMDGLTFLTTLRAQAGEAGSIPALVTSTEAKPQDREAASRAGANFYLVKPLREEALLAHVLMLSGAAA